VAAGIRGGATRGVALASQFVSETLTSDVVAKVARLARLELDVEELAAATAQLAAMLEHFADIDSLDLDEIEPMTQPYPLTNVMREDVVITGLDRDEVMRFAPDTEDGRFRVPPIIGIEQ
jgi:aspartyl-tRNA(Asn)/glutamyl-tRNA(Gln) amidotransferase subunit C